MLRRTKAAEERAAAVEARLNQPAQPQGPSAADKAREAEEERAALAVMNDQEKAMYHMAKEVRNLKAALPNVQLQLQDGNDKASFSSYVTANPKYQRYAADVEKAHGEFTKLGQFVQRRAVLAFVVGNAVLNSKEPGKQKRAAAGRVRAQTTRGSGVRSDTGGTRSSKGSLVSRMERDDVPI